jgi:hypothetical protein
MLVAPSAIATAMDTSAIPRPASGNFPARASAGPSAAVSPAWPASLRSSTAPACPTRPSPSPVTFSAWSQPVSCITKRAPARRWQWCGYRVISQNRGALRYPACHGRRHRPCPVQPKVARSGLRLRVILRSPELPCETLPGLGRAGGMSCVTTLAARVASPSGRASPGRFEVGYPAGIATAGHRAGRPGQRSWSGGSFGPTCG